MSHRVRNLNVIFIDDLIGAPKEGITVNLSVRRNLESVARLLVRPEASNMDVVVCDVRFSRGDHPSGLDWGADADAAPGYGPLLALPFLQTGGVCTFVPVSTAWGDFQDNGYVLAALALILTKTTGRAHTFDEAHAWIGERLADGVDVRRDIKRGVRSYRDRLIELATKGEEAAVCGLADAMQLVRDWRPSETLADANGVPAHIEILTRRGCDRVAVESLFADVLDLSPLADKRRATLLKEMEAMHGVGASLQFEREAAIYDRAVSLLNDALPGGSEEWFSLKEKANLVATNDDDKHCLIRFAILFSFLRGLYFTSVAKEAYRKTVRSSSKQLTDRYYRVMDWVYFSTGLDPDQSAVANPFKRFLGEERDRKFFVSVRPHCQPFAKRFVGATGDKVLKAYSCLKDPLEPGDLTVMEKVLCRRFILDDRFFPSAMPVEDRITWEPHDAFGQAPYPVWLND